MSLVDLLPSGSEGDPLQRCALGGSNGCRILTRWHNGWPMGVQRPYPVRRTISPHGHQTSVPVERQPPQSAGVVVGWKEIFYNPGPGQFASVGIMTKPAFMFGNPRRVVPAFPGGSSAGSDDRTTSRRSGKFVSTISPAKQCPEHTRGRTRIQVVLNWFEDLRARVPVTR